MKPAGQPRLSPEPAGLYSVTHVMFGLTEKMNRLDVNDRSSFGYSERFVWEITGRW